MSDREASDAIEVMRENERKRPGQPWMIQVRGWGRGVRGSEREGNKRGEGE